MMNETQENVMEKAAGSGGGIAKFLLSKPVDCAAHDACEYRTKIVIVGCGSVGVAIGVGILFKKLAAEVVFIDENEDLAKAEADDIAHGSAFLGSPKIYGTKDFSLARDATICIIAVGKQHADPYEGLDKNIQTFKTIIPNVSKYAPKSILLIVSNPVDVLSYAAMKLSGFPANRVIGLGTLLDNCRLRHLVAKELGLATGAVQSMVIGESGPASVPIWSAVSVMGMKLKDINKDIGTSTDPEGWSNLHSKIINTDRELITRKGHHCWAAALCTCEIVDAVVRNTCACLTVSTFVKGCRHGLEKDVFASLPCVVGRTGILSYVRHLYTPDERESTTRSCRHVYEAQKSVLSKLE